MVFEGFSSAVGSAWASEEVSHGLFPVAVGTFSVSVSVSDDTSQWCKESTSSSIDLVEEYFGSSV